MLMLVRLRRGREASFRRAVRNRSGAVVKMLVFPPHEAVALSGKEFAAVKSDIGFALEEVRPDERGLLRVVATAVDPPEIPDETPPEPAEETTDQTAITIPANGQHAQG